MMKIYRVGGYYATGVYHSHLAAAHSPKEAMNMVLAADNRFVRITKAIYVEDAK